MKDLVLFAKGHFEEFTQSSDDYFKVLAIVLTNHFLCDFDGRTDRSINSALRVALEEFQTTETKNQLIDKLLWDYETVSQLDVAHMLCSVVRFKRADEFDFDLTEGISDKVMNEVTEVFNVSTDNSD